MLLPFIPPRSLIVSLLTLGTSCANAALLGSFTTTVTPSALNPVSQIVSFRMSIGSFGSDCFDLNPSCTVMFDISNATAGSTFILNSSSPAFAATAAMLSDGVDDLIEIPSVIGSSVPATTGGSSGFFESVFGTTPGPDFSGDTIGYIMLHFNSIEFSQLTNPPILPPGSYTQANVDFTISVFDATEAPEPTTFFLCAVPLLGFLYYGRKQRRAD